MPEKIGKPASKAATPSFDFDAGQSRSVIRPDMLSDWTVGRKFLLQANEKIFIK